MANVAAGASVHARRIVDGDVDAQRMSFGDHLEELRSRLIRSLVGVVLATTFTLMFGRQIVEFIYKPLVVVQMANGLQPQLQALSPTSAFTAYMKISFLTGLIIAMPWVLHQAWMFVVTGLYKHEKRFVRLLIPTSTALFVVGVAFLYVLVLPVVLQFFISFNREFGISDLAPTAIHSLFVPAEPPVVDSNDGSAVVIPFLSADPENATPGQVWFNTKRNRIMVQGPNGVLSMAADRGPTAPIMQSQFAIDSYVSFVLILSLAFGLAFETPIVVFFLAWSGLVATDTMVRSRRIVILGIVFIAAVMTPPDVISLTMLSLPMYLLFEGGLFAARVAERRRPVVEESVTTG